MSRRITRENLFKLTYERCVIGEKNALSFNLVYDAEPEAQKQYFLTVYNGIDDKFDFLKKIIGDLAQEFVVDRIYKVDLAILLVSLYEILYCDDIPDEVSINEAVELSKTYSTEKSSVFINGILAAVKKNKEKIIQSESEKDGETDAQSNSENN